MDSPAMVRRSPAIIPAPLPYDPLPGRLLMTHVMRWIATVMFVLSAQLAIAQTWGAPTFSEDPDRDGVIRERTFFAHRHTPYEDGLPREYLDRTWKAISALPVETEDRSSPAPGWRCIGPFGFNSNYLPNGPSRWTGRVLDLELQQNGLMRFAAASGGLWEAFFGAAPLSDGITSLAIGSFATKPTDPNTIIVGTGEAGTGRTGTGVWKTTDGGGSWRNLPVYGVAYVNKVRFDPAVPGFVYAATNLGFYRSTDDGENWTRTFNLVVWDFAFASSGSQRLIYVVTANNGVWRSLDDGFTFPDQVPDLPVSGHVRGAISAGPSTVGSVGSVMYVMFSTSSTLQGIFRSDNAGYAWTPVTPPLPIFGGGQTRYNQAIGVCPTNPNIVIAGWVKLYRTSNAGQTWDLVDNLQPNNHDRTHDDWHNILWTGGTGVYAANDGGIFYSDDLGMTWGPALAYAVAPITQFYNFDIGENDPGIIYGGAQDNGTVGTTVGGAGWLGTRCCDAAGISIDPFDAARMYTVAGSAPPPRGGTLYRSINSGLNWTGIGAGLTAASVIRNDRFSPVKLYTDNGMQIMTSLDNGDTWNPLNPSPMPSNASNITVGLPWSSGAGTVVYAPLEAGGLWVYDQGVWGSRVTGLPPGALVLKVATHSREYFVAYALMKGVGANLEGNKVFKTVNRGLSWTNITGNLPNIPLADLIPHPTDPNILYLGTEMGCYKTTDGGATWIRWNYGMPEACIVTEMKFIDSLAINGKFYVAAATYGRSIWLRDVSTEDPVGRRRVRRLLTLPITDNTTARDTLHIPASEGGGTVVRAVIRLDSLLHTFDGSLTVTLLHQGVRDTLVQNTGGEGHDFLATTLDDDAGLGLGEGLPPFTGVFRPVQPLSHFNGVSAAGDWILEIHDGQSGNSGELHGWSLIVDAAAQQLPVEVTENWNLISVPLVVPDSSRSGLFPYATSDAFAFDHGYVPSTTLRQGTGYWLKFAGPDTVTLTGLPLAEDSIHVLPGWNLIGSISTPVAVANIGSIPAGIVTSSFFAYSPPGYAAAGSIESGKAYWVKATQSGTLILSTALIPPAGRITILPTSEMPPPPPGTVPAAGATLPAAFALEQNYPNPFNPTTDIRLQITDFGRVRLVVYDLLGRQVATLVDEYRAPGSYTVKFDGTNIASGVYICRLTTGKFTDTKRMVLMR
jgi:hypothetical protein